MLISIQKAANILGVSIQTLRRWDKSNHLKPTYLTKGGHRRYNTNTLTNISNQSIPNNNLTIAYARVSTHDQINDLNTQANSLAQYCANNNYNFEIIKDLGSGLNYNKKGLLKLLNLIHNKKINRIVLTHKDRLLRFGSQLIFNLCKLNNIEVIIINDNQSNDLQTNLVHDVIELMTVFSAKLHGHRSHKNKKSIAPS